MSRWIDALASVAILVAVFLTGALFADASVMNDVRKDCERYQAFYIDDIRYACRRLGDSEGE